MSDKIYIGTGKERVFPDGGRTIKLSLSVKDVGILQDNLDADGWVRIDINQRKEPSKTGQTHYGTLNTWRPESRQANQPISQPAAAPVEQPKMTDEQLPF